MAFRTFRDSDGTEWQVYDVVPRRYEEERRHEERRSGEYDPSDENRRVFDRRVTIGSISTRLGDGWLCFESAGQRRRRYSPIPDNWLEAPDERLDDWCKAARPAGLSQLDVRT